MQIERLLESGPCFLQPALVPEPLGPGLERAGAPGVASRADLERAGQGLLGLLGVKSERPLSRKEQVAEGRCFQLADVLGLPGRAAQFERGFVVVGKDIGEILDPLSRSGLDPGGSSLVTARAPGARDLGVGDVADERMPEAVLGLSFHRAGPARTHKLLARQLVQRLLRVCQVALAHSCQRAGPEHLAQHRRVLQQALPLRGQGVEARRDQRLHRSRQLDLLPQLAPVNEQADELFGIQGIPTGPLQQLPLRLRRQHRPLQQRRNQLLRRLIAQRREVDPLPVAGVRAEGRVLLVQLRPRRAQKEQRHPFRPIGQVFDESEQRRIGPVQILEHQHRRPTGRQPFHEAPPSGERLLLRNRLAGEADERTQPS